MPQDGGLIILDCAMFSIYAFLLVNEVGEEFKGPIPNINTLMTLVLYNAEASSN